MGVPYDLASAYSYYLWASHLGHGKASLCAANMIYEEYVNFQENQNYLEQYPTTKSDSLIPHDLNYALQLYLAAIQRGLPDAMNAYAMLIEEGNGIDFPPNTSDRDRMMEAAKWYYAATEKGKVESAGNLLLLLTTYPYLHELETLDGRYLPIQEVKMWLHSYTQKNNTLYESLKIRDILPPNADEKKNQLNTVPTSHSHHYTSTTSNHEENKDEVIRNFTNNQYLYSKNNPDYISSIPQNPILSKLELYPAEERRDYLTNKLRTYSKFSLTSDLIARKIEYSDNMKWNQQIEQKNKFLTNIQSGQGTTLPLPVPSPLPRPLPLPGNENSNDFKNLSKFVQTVNRFPIKSINENKIPTNFNPSSTSRDTVPNPIPLATKPKSLKNSFQSSKRMGGIDYLDSKEDSDFESSELDMERIEVPKSRNNFHPNPSDGRSIQEYLDGSEKSDDGDLPRLTHQQDKHVSLE